MAQKDPTRDVRGQGRRSPLPARLPFFDLLVFVPFFHSGEGNDQQDHAATAQKDQADKNIIGWIEQGLTESDITEDDQS